jgi:hypothetical protein
MECSFGFDGGATQQEKHSALRPLFGSIGWIVCQLAAIVNQRYRCQVELRPRTFRRNIFHLQKYSPIDTKPLWVLQLLL